MGRAFAITLGLLALAAVVAVAIHFIQLYVAVRSSFSEQLSFAERYECTEREGPFSDPSIIRVDRTRSDACYGDSTYAIPSVDAYFRDRMQTECFLSNSLYFYYGALTPSGARPFINSNPYRGFLGQYECLWLSLHFPSASYQIRCSRPLDTCTECFCSLEFSPDGIHVIKARIPNTSGAEALLRLAADWAAKLNPAH